MGERPNRATASRPGGDRATAKGARHTDPDRWVRMTVSYTVEQYEWLREQAFEQHSTIAAVLRGCVSECVDRSGGADAVRISMLHQAVTRDETLSGGDADTSPGWIRLSLSFTPEQHAWLWRRAFEERATLATMVRRYVSDAHLRLRSRPQGGEARVG